MKRSMKPPLRQEVILPQGRLFLSGMTHLFDIGNYAQAS